MSDWHDDSNAHAPEPGDAAVSWSQPSAARPAPAARERLDVARLAPWLPRLGATLWLVRKCRRAHTPALLGARGVLLFDHPALTTLARCTHADAHVQVTSHGPREWLSFRDAEGTAIAKLYLLPDTDYLAWDEMIAACGLAPPSPEPGGWHAHAAFLRTALARLGAAWQARLVTFEHRSLPWLARLGARAPLKLSLLGLELARLIASSEGADLVTPLHAS